jgi:DNA-binding MarR family transcriptional regulator
MVHAIVYYPLMRERSAEDTALHEAANALAAAIHLATPRRAAPTPARDLTFGQARLLFLLLREGPIPMGRIAEVFDLSSTASTGFVQRVERHGLVERRHRSDDRRVVECALTDAGRAFAEELAGLRLDAMRRTFSVLDPDELAEITRLLRLIVTRHESAS